MANATAGNQTKLKRGLSVFQVIAMALAATSPTASVFLTYGAAWASAGTGLVLGFLIGAVLAYGLALTYAEGGSAYQLTTGGDYSIVSQALGPKVGSIYTALFTFKGIVIPSVLSIATAAYIQALIPSLPVNWTAVAVLLIILFLAFEGIHISGIVATVMVVIETIVLLGFIIVSATHIHQSVAILVHPMMTNGPHVFVAATAAGILSSVVSALFAYNGWEASLYFSEETRTNPRGIGKTVAINISIIVALEFIAIVLATLALPRLNLQTSAAIPLAVVIRAAIGPIGAGAILIGVVIAQFDSALASTLTYGRIYYAIARDGQWPRPLNSFFSRINRHGAPYGPFIVLGVINLIICIVSSLTSLVIFTGALLMVLYLGVAISSFVTRRRAKPAFRMPLWPVPPLIGIVGILLVFTQLSLKGILVVVGMVALGFLWSFLTPAKSAIEDLPETSAN